MLRRPGGAGDRAGGRAQLTGTTQAVGHRPAAVSWWPLAVLCVTEVVSWGVLYYAFPVALASITADTGWSTTATTAAFSAGLVVSAVVGVPVGRWLDRVGPRPVMTAGSVLAVACTVGIATAPTLVWFVLAWLVAGVAMAAVFYQAAFAALTRWYGPARVRALTVLTLAAGLASTVFAPLTSVLLAHLDWRATYLVLAGVLAAVTVPLHAAGLSLPWTAAAADPMSVARSDVRAVVTSRSFVLLAGALTLTAFGLYAASLTLIPLLTARGMSAGLAAVTLGLLGAGQLLGRVGWSPLTARTTPATRTLLVVAGSAIAVALLATVPGPGWLLVILAVLAGAVRGAGTLLQATVVADRWGTQRYGSLAGWFAAPITAASALAPFGGTLIATWVGGYPAAFAVLGGVIAVGGITAWAGMPRRSASGMASSG